METIRGKLSLDLDSNGLQNRIASYNRLAVDLGTGDGRYVRTLALSRPDWFVVGVDACRENLREHSRAKLPNGLFVIASAGELPPEFNGLFSQVTINFPWGSLLGGLLAGDPGLMRGLASISRLNARIEIRLNGGAVLEAGTSLEVGTERIYENLKGCGWAIKIPMPMDHSALRSFPTTWAKRLAYGRDPRAISLSGRRID